VKTSNNIVHVKIGMRAVLSCDVISVPHATVHWFHRGSPILINNRFTRHDTELVSFFRSLIPLFFAVLKFFVF